MRLAKGGAGNDTHRIGVLFLVGIVVMLFCCAFALADSSMDLSMPMDDTVADITATPTDLPTDVVTEVAETPTGGVTEVAATPTELMTGRGSAPPAESLYWTTSTLPPYDPNFVRTLDEKGQVFTIRSEYKKVTDAERNAAAARFKELYGRYLLEHPGGDMGIEWNLTAPPARGVMIPGGIPQFMGPNGNYAYSPMPWGPITSVTIVNPGSGYNVGDNVTVIDYWGTGSGAVVNVSAIDANGNITALTLLNGGMNYSAPWLIFNATNRTASATASIMNLTANGTYTHGLRKFIDSIPSAFTGGNASELVSHIPIATPDTTSFPPGGVGYTSAPTITIYDETGTGATAIANMNGTVVANVTIINGGTNYTLNPVVTFSGGGATTQAIAGTPTVVNGVITAIPLTGAHYYELELIAFPPISFHSDLPNTSGIWGYRQVNGQPGGGPIHYLGPIIIAHRNIPVRIKFVNRLPANGATANLSVPVDTTIMGAGMGPLGMTVNPSYYTQNRATIHLHGGETPWISDGTPYQWTTPNGTNTTYPHGTSVYNVPDMPDAGPNPQQGNLTFYYTNQQSARLLFYHDHAEAITRLNVYVGEASAYLLSDDVEDDLIFGTNNTGVNPGNLTGILPGHGIPLVIQDKTFVDNATIAYQDPTWGWGTDYANTTTTKRPITGDLWVPHVYMPAENPWDPTGVNAFGRWPYSPWEMPPREGTHGPIANIYYDPLNRPWEPLLTPGTPNPSMVPEAFQDTPIVNGAAYPWMYVEPTAYRFRILSVANDRFFTLNFYVANTSIYTNSLGIPTELNLVPNPNGANGTNITNPVVPSDTAGPSFLKIGTEGGFLPAPVGIPAQPTTYDQAGNVLLHGLALGPAERADVVVNFSAFAGQTLILYNDAPTPWPGSSSIYNFYTNNSDQTSAGGSPPTLPGYGPNTRTIMAFRVNATITPGAETPNATTANINAAFAKTAAKRGVFEVSEKEIVIPQAAYNTAFNQVFTDTFINAVQTTVSFTALRGYGVNNFPVTNKLLQDAFPDAYDEYGRLIGMLGLTSPGGPTGTIYELYGYVSPPVDLIKATIPGAQIGTLTDGTQIWRIHHAGTDTHPIHWHLYTIQPINRVNSSDGLVIPIPPDEIGWRETFRTNPFQDTIVAIRPNSLNLPWDLPNSRRNISPNDPGNITIPIAGPGGWGYLDIAGSPVNVVNKVINYGGEFVFHCHILGHEEGDMMHAVIFGDYPNAPLNLTARNIGNFTNPVVNLSWIDNSMDETNWTIQRTTNLSTPWTTIATIPSTTEVFMNVTVFYIDNTVVNNTTYYYQVMALNTMGDTTQYPANAAFPTLTVNSTPSNIFNFTLRVHDMVGSFSNGTFYLDYNGNFTWDGAPPDKTFPWTGPGYVPIKGDWNGTGLDYIGSYSNGTFYLDYNGNFTWDGPVIDRTFGWTGPGWDPIVGDWNGDGKAGIGTYSSGIFVIDFNENFTWDGPAVDKIFWWTTSGWTPVVGDWNGSGTSKIGTYRNGTFVLDYNGNFVWDPTTDKMFNWTAFPYVPVVGDWNGDHKDGIGTYSNGTFVLDVNENFTWDGAPPDAIFPWTAFPYVPVIGDWNGDGKDGVGTFSGAFYLDYNDNYVWDPLIDKFFLWTSPAYTPIIGKWSFT